MWLFPLNVCKEEIKDVYYISTRQYIHFSLLVSFLLLQRFMAFKHQQKVCSNWIKSTKKMQNSISFYCKILLWRSSSVQTIVGMKYSINIHFFQCSINNCQIWDEGSPKRKKTPTQKRLLLFTQQYRNGNISRKWLFLIQKFSQANLFKREKKNEIHKTWGYDFSKTRQHVENCLKSSIYTRD